MVQGRVGFVKNEDRKRARVQGSRVQGPGTRVRYNLSSGMQHVKPGDQGGEESVSRVTWTAQQCLATRREQGRQHPPDITALRSGATAAAQRGCRPQSALPQRSTTMTQQGSSRPCWKKMRNCGAAGEVG